MTTGAAFVDLYGLTSDEQGQWQGLRRTPRRVVRMQYDGVHFSRSGAAVVAKPILHEVHAELARRRAARRPGRTLGALRAKLGLGTAEQSPLASWTRRLSLLGLCPACWGTCGPVDQTCAQALRTH